ncbi:hypothetical protein [Aquimarina macrocephali]|uniref:hypothetical protein n=1 Tax=Aquimarina macrocephali TaxID=666563 RepID=UPI003F666AB6
MNFLLLLIAIFLIVRAIIVKTVNLFTSNNEVDNTPNITINNYTTEQHLHITQDQFEKLKK